MRKETPAEQIWVGRHILTLSFLLLFTIATFSLHATTLDERKPYDTRQGWVLKGKVTDEEGGAMPGVSVVVKNTTRGTTTDANGEFLLEINSAGEVLVFSFVGYLPQEAVVGDQRELSVSLQPDLERQAIDEVVVVGYGTQKRRDLTGSISSVSGKQLNQVPSSRRVDQALQGLAPGVQVTQTDAQPGGNVKIQIRGGNSIQGNNAPVFVIDGFVGPGNLADINPADIASIEILKDASATAIYGARGANGVIIVTTKKGAAGKARIDFGANYGFQRVRHKIDMLNATEFAQLVNEQRANDGLPPHPTFPADLSTLGEGTDWQNELFRTAPMQDYALSFSGGSEQSRYFISGNYYDQDGIIVNSGFKRGALRLNLDNQISDKFRIGTNLSASFTGRNGIVVNTDPLATSPNVINAALRYSPIAPVQNEDGSYFYDTEFSSTVENPVALAEEQTRNFTNNRFLGTFFGEYTFFEGLSLRITVGGNILNGKDNFYNPRTTLTGRGSNGSATISNELQTNWMNDNILTYTKHVNNDHSFSIAGGFSQQAFHAQSSSVSNRNFVTDALLYNNLGLGEDFVRPSSDDAAWGLQSFLTRATYNYRDKYLFTGTARADGSSKFGADNKWAYFPSASVKWRISEEYFMEGLSFLDDLSIRTSYGLTGSEGIAAYLSLAAMNGTRSYILGDAARVGVGPGRIANPNLKWESTAQFDMGMDIAAWNNRLALTVDYYNKKTTDLLFNVSVPSQSGYTTALTNIGSIGNKGWEFALQGRILEGEVAWNAGANLYWNRSEVLSLGENREQYYGGSNYLALSNLYVLRVGEPVGAFYGYVDDGIFQNSSEVETGIQPGAKPGDLRYVDLDENGIVNALDRTIIGYAQPDFNYGFSTDLSYRGFELSMLIHGVKGGKLLNLNNFDLLDVSGQQNNSRQVLDRWTPEHPSNTISRATQARNTRPSNRFLEDGSFMRLKNISLAYNLPTPLIGSAGLRSVRVFVSGQNLITRTDYSGYDPEVNSRGEDNVQIGTDFGSYPTAKIVTLGIQVGF